MENFENNLISFLKIKSPSYLEILTQVKGGEQIFSGLVLGDEKKFSLVLLTPSRIISLSEDEANIFYLEHIINLKIKSTTKDNKGLIDLNIQFTQGNISITASKDYTLTLQFLNLLQNFSTNIKKGVYIPPPEPLRNPIGFDTSGDSSA